MKTPKMTGVLEEIRAWENKQTAAAAPEAPQPEINQRWAVWDEAQAKVRRVESAEMAFSKLAAAHDATLALAEHLAEALRDIADLNRVNDEKEAADRAVKIAEAALVQPQEHTTFNLACPRNQHDTGTCTCGESAAAPASGYTSESKTSCACT